MKKIIWIFVLSVGRFFGQNSEFPINDPRNPNCPCHKYQKLADEEYKRLLANANGQSVNLDKNLHETRVNQIIINRNQNRTNSGNSQAMRHYPEKMNPIQQLLLPVNSLEQGISLSENDFSNQKNYNFKNEQGKHYHSKLKHKKKKFLDKHKKLRKFLNVKGWDVWKDLRNVSSCYHWS